MVSSSNITILDKIVYNNLHSLKLMVTVDA